MNLIEPVYAYDNFFKKDSLHDWTNILQYLFIGYVILQLLLGRDSGGLENLAGHTAIRGRSIEVSCFGSMSYGSTKRSESSASRRSL